MITRLLGVALLASCLATPVVAQVSIRVVDSSGHPVPAVLIEVYGRGELIAVTSTSADGGAQLSSERWSQVRRITLRHLGFQTLIVQVDEIPPDGLIQLESRPIEIEGLTVEARELCPINDSPEARRRWSEVASLYSRETGSRAWSVYYSGHAGRVQEVDLHRPTDSGAVGRVSGGGAGVVHGGDRAPSSLDDHIRTEGYAWPPLIIGGTTGSRTRAWKYPQLDHEHAYHFASSVFGALHNFEVVRESEGQTTLAFCPNGAGNGATIKGLLTLGPGEALIAAEWRFETKDPDEGAGGAVSFASYIEAPGLKPHLVASRGLFYLPSGRKSPYPDGPRTYARVVTVQSRWYIHPSAEHPCKPGGGRGFFTVHTDPPNSPLGIRFSECVARYWGLR